MARIRGLLGLSAVGGAIGAVLGAAWTFVSSFTAWAPFTGFSILGGAAFWGMFAALASGGFGLLLTTIGSRRSLDEIPIWKAGLMGVTAGAAIPLVAVSLLNGAVPSILAALPMMGFAGGLGGILSSGLIAVAKAAPAELGAIRGTEDFLGDGN